MLRAEDYEQGRYEEKKEITVQERNLWETVPAQDENYQSFIVRYNQNVEGTVQYESDRTFQIIDDMFGVTYVPASQVPEPLISSFSYFSVPKCYTYMDQGSLGASGVTRLHEHPYLKLKGSGTLIAVIDSGIDYRHPAFRNGDRTKIVSIWDQNIPGGLSKEAPFGRVYNREEIDRALSEENPLEIVPSIDESGHGTMLAGAAAGNGIPEEGFSGAAPQAELVIVKLKPAKQYLRELYLLPPEKDIFQEDDIMLGISFAVKIAFQLKKPLAICIGLGTSQGSIGEKRLLVSI